MEYFIAATLQTTGKYFAGKIDSKEVTHETTPSHIGLFSQAFPNLATEQIFD